MAPERQYSTLSFKALMEASVVFDAPNWARTACELALALFAGMD
jgi:hypothetical protein